MATIPSALLLFSRLPVLGSVKTRLMPRFSEAEALALHQALLADSLDLLRHAADAANASTWLYLSEAGPLKSVITSHLGACRILVQQGASLGERLHQAFQERFEAGAKRVVVLGSDSPQVPTSVIVRALESLPKNDLVLGPARDGGYYLLGLSRLQSSLFTGIPWGTSQVYRETVRRARSEGLSIASMPAFYDVDVPDSVVALWDDLSRRRAKGDSAIPASCFTLLQEWARQGKLE
jgi:hypothetical protein